MQTSEKRIQTYISTILDELNLDFSDKNLKDTPKRITKMLQNEFLSSVGKKLPEEHKTTFPNEGYDEIIMLDNIPFTSLCSHHFLPFSGLSYLLYIPNEKLIGASKPARIIDFYCKKPQLQENLGIEIMNAFMRIVKPSGAMLVMRAIHNCMSCRGVKTGLGAGMTTSITRGAFRSSPELEMKGLSLIQLSKEK